MDVTEFLSHLESVEPQGDRQWQARCPSHDDNRASLSISVGDDGRILTKCHASCATADVVRAMKLKMADLFAPAPKIKATKAKTEKIVTEYSYVDESGVLLFQSVRFEPKDFRQRAPDGNGGWNWKTKGIAKVLYRLPELLAAPKDAIIWVCEGEKDVDNLAALGALATTNVGGAGKWKKEYAKHFAGRIVAILGDNDDAGRDHAQDVAASTCETAAQVKIVALPDLPPKGDVSDWLAAGGTLENLVSLFHKASKWAPEAKATAARKAPVAGANHATAIVKLAEGADLWHDPDGTAFATFDVSGHREHCRITAKPFRLWLSQRFYAEHGGSPNAAAMTDALVTLEGKALYEGDEHQSHLRIAERGAAIYLDLADADWRAVEVTAAGWRVIDEPPVRFRRPKNMHALPEPKRGGSINDLRRFVNVTDGDWPLVLAWLIAALRPRGPYPVLVAHGEQGSAKSCTATVLRKLIDPNRALLRGEPREARDLAIWGHNGWIVAMDNLSHIQPWLSDALCRMATGGGFSTRTLFQDDEETVFEGQRPILFTGIEETATRADLIDRAVMISLPRIATCVPEAQLWKEFDTAKPAILGALLDAVACAIRTLPEVQLDSLPRMADFALWATAAESGLLLPRGAFMSSYAGNREAANELAIEASPIGKYVLQLADDVADDPDGFCGTPTELVARLDKIAGHTEKVRPPKGWPTPRAIRGALTRIAPNLRRSGVEIDFEKTAKARLIRIRKKVVIIVTSVMDAGNATDLHGGDDDPDDRVTIRDDAPPLENAVNDEHDDNDDVSPYSRNGEEVQTWTF